MRYFHNLTSFFFCLLGQFDVWREAIMPAGDIFWLDILLMNNTTFFYWWIFKMLEKCKRIKVINLVLLEIGLIHEPHPNLVLL